MITDIPKSHSRGKVRGDKDEAALGKAKSDPVAITKIEDDAVIDEILNILREEENAAHE